MFRNLLVLLSIILIISCQQKSNSKKKDKEEKKSTKIFTGEIEKLATGFAFTEGPAADSLGNVYFTDIPKNQILIWRTEQKLDTFQLKSGGANGLYFDKNENLLVCEGGKGRIAAYQKNEDYKVIASKYNGKRFNQPNDIWPNPKGGIYFSDPKYAKNPELPQEGEHVYYIQTDGDVFRVTDDLKKPNGLIGTSHGKTLFITDTELDKTFKYTIQPDGNLSDKKLFIDQGSDGMTLDKNGNLYLTTVSNNQVEVFSKEGQKITSIELPEKPSNVCFGGKQDDQLFVTARTSLYRVKTNTKG